MKGGSGFTIVETMIVLAVTMLIFLSAVLLINGKQNNTAFNQSIRAVQNQIEQIISDVGSGYYSSNGRLKCDAPGGIISLTTGAANSQGTNKDCLFMGKVLQFKVRDTDPEKYNVYTLVGLRSAGDLTTGTFILDQARARVVANTPTDTPPVPDMFDSPILQYGLSVKEMYYNNPANQIGAVGFISNVTSLGASDGSQRVDVVAFPGTAINQTSSAGAAQINDSIRTASSVIAPPEGVSICFVSGGTKQSGLISVGTGGREGTVTLKIFNDKDCGNP